MQNYNISISGLLVLVLQFLIKRNDWLQVLREVAGALLIQQHGEGNQQQAAPAKRWSSGVTHESNALDLENKVFKLGDPKKIAQSLKRSAEKSNRRKGTPFQSAMSMLNFYINRAGKNLSATAKKPLQKAKSELRALYGKEKK